MEDTLDYGQVPSYFVHCFNAACPRAGECLRQLAGRHVDASRAVVQAVSPAVWPAGGGACEWFKPMRLVRRAWGVREAIGRMPYRDGRLVVKALNQMYAKATLNRISNHLLPLDEVQQRRIETLFARYGVTGERVFDRVEMVYDW